MSSSDEAMPIIDDDLYSVADVNEITRAFAPLMKSHTPLAESIAIVRDMMQYVHQGMPTLRALSEIMNNCARDPLMIGSIVSTTQATVHGAQASQKQLCDNLALFCQMMASRMRCERMAVYYRIAKIQPVHSVSDKRCDTRCVLGKSSHGAPLVRQKCCNALVCTSCLYLYNFDNSNMAMCMYAPCFQCNRQRGIFKHWAPTN